MGGEQRMVGKGDEALKCGSGWLGRDLGAAVAALMVALPREVRTGFVGQVPQEFFGGAESRLRVGTSRGIFSSASRQRRFVLGGPAVGSCKKSSAVRVATPRSNSARRPSAEATARRALCLASCSNTSGSGRWPDARRTTRGGPDQVR